MPIRSDRMKLYPGGGTHSKEWKAFRASLIERARNACEGRPKLPECRAANGQPHPKTGSKVVLTIAQPLRMRRRREPVRRPSPRVDRNDLFAIHGHQAGEWV
ncbi:MULTISPECIES: hypothetical protein [Ensifer]|jgi:hypothetical protein|uniref:Transposase n=1 Tax=Ensifer canadensis TaxID=555315 RepID=A0AAW4FKN2_9HYPH|nr:MULTISPECIES: hypothetical protein [Ensifer]MBM3092717.1 hypothetical protein [Ensifer canadensis]UBI79679.1 hypothetical protein J3R84_32675 [Ensifer canadensis]